MKKIIGAILLITTAIGSSSAIARDLTPQEKGIIEAAAKQQMKDPDSAKFFWQDYKGSDIYCAHVNAKNSYGGYAGKALLLVGVKTNKRGQITSAETTIRSDNMMDRICTEAGYHP